MLFVLRSFFLLFLFSAAIPLCAQQKEANVWYFGRYLGIDFNSGAPVPLNDGQLNTTEGVATISDSNGGLLFYTDGISIWNKIHQVMPNGTGLFGDPSSSQSAVIVPKIGDNTRYYVFTVDQLSGPRGLNYSIVNMTLDNGKGDVELKNSPMISNVVEKVTAVRHCNNRDVWVVAHGSVSDIYYSFLVTPAGVTLVPVTSHAGVVLPGVVPPSSVDSSSLGYLKASPDGTKIAAAHWTVNVDVCDFDNATGVVSNGVSMYLPGDPHYLSYGVEFSPNSNLLYSSVFYTDPVTAQKRNALYQYDITLGSAAAIRASRQVISLNADPIDTYAALQIAPDGKIYMAKRAYKNIASISNPNVYGPGCVFTASAVQYTLPNQVSSYGLPTFVQSYFYPPDSFTHTVSCQTLTASFNYTPASNVVSVLWDFDDPASGANNASTVNNPFHTFSVAGIYTVKLIKFTNCGTDTIKKQVSTDAININLGPDTTVCTATSLLLNSSGIGSSNTFLWQDGSTNPTFLAITAGLYWVEARNAAGCIKRDSINVAFKTLPVFNLGADSPLCSGDTLTLNATVSGAISYLWNTNATTATIKAFQSGLYWCQVNNGGCIFRDSLTITALLPKPVVSLGNDITLCGTSPVPLDATSAGSTYLWQNGSTNPTFLATTSGLYWVEVRGSNGCTKRDSINITFKPTPVFNLGPDTPVCSGDSLTLNATTAGAIGYLWSNGATTSIIKVNQPGLYWCEVNNGGCSFRDSLTITSVKPSPIINLGNDVTVCEGVPVTFDATYLNSGYLWQDGSTSPFYTALQQGTYYVEVNYNGCKKSDTVIITHNLKPRFTLGSDQFICPGNTLTLRPVLDPSWQRTWQDGSTGPTYTLTQPGLYSLSATNNCGATTSQVLVTKGLCSVFVPTGFTPNNDGKNDWFRALGTEAVTQFNIKVFDRAGQLIFETSDKSKGWDGMVKGVPLPSAVFIYLLAYKDIYSAETRILKGTLALIR
ncbi:MAG: T9SS type B sorting domain-containing protein [Chitinophagaceae bacterium]